MAQETDGLHSFGSNSSKDRWALAIASGFRTWREERAKKLVIQQLVDQDERILEDIGLSRSKLVRDLGHDPCDLPGHFNAGTYLNPNFQNQCSISQNHASRRR